MKKYFLIFTILYIFVSCKTTKGANCDAYSKHTEKPDTKRGSDKQDVRQNVFVY